MLFIIERVDIPRCIFFFVPFKVENSAELFARLLDPPLSVMLSQVRTFYCSNLFALDQVLGGSKLGGPFP